MTPLSGNRYLDAFLKLILLSALIHTVIKISSAILFKDTTVLNYFHVLEIDLLFPQIIQVTGGDMGSLAAWVIGYTVVFFLFTK